MVDGKVVYPGVAEAFGLALADPNCSVWYAFTPAVTGSVSARFVGFLPTFSLAAYTGNSLGGLTEIGCRGFELFKSVPGRFQQVGVLTQSVPVRPGGRTTDFAFSYTFTADDAQVGKVTFKAVANSPGRVTRSRPTMRRLRRRPQLTGD